MNDFDAIGFAAALKEETRNMPREERMAYVRGRLSNVPAEYKAIVQAVLDIARESDSDIVVLIHGIRTAAVWQSKLEPIIRREIPGLQVISAKYGFFDLIRFVLPGRRKGPIGRIKRELRDARLKARGGQISVIAHSFGTYVISQILRKEPDIKVFRLITCGSIIKPEFRWDLLPGNLTEDVVNDCGSKDYLPVLAKTTANGYGPSGFYGFGTARVRDRFHECGHSGFFTEDFMKRFWIPLLRDGEIVTSDFDRPQPQYVLNLLSLFDGSVWYLLLLIGGLFYYL